MKKIRRQTAKKTQRFNRKRYSNPQGIKVTAWLSVTINGKSTKPKGLYVFTENGEFVKIQRYNGMKRYYPVYYPLYGSDALKYLWRIFN